MPIRRRRATLTQARESPRHLAGAHAISQTANPTHAHAESVAQPGRQRPGLSDDHAEGVAERVQRLRRERGLSQRAFLRVGVSAAYVSLIERGKRTPSHKALAKMAPLLGVSVEYLSGAGELAYFESRLADCELGLRFAPDAAELIPALEQLLMQAERAGAGGPVALARGVLGLAMLATGREQEAVELLEQATGSPHLAIAQRPDFYLALGRTYIAGGDPDSTVALFKHCLAQLEQSESPDRLLLARFNNMLSHALGETGDTQAAKQAALASVEQVGDLEDAHSRARLDWAIARTHWNEDNPDLAARYFRHAITELELTEERAQLGLSHLTAASVLIDDERLERAEEHLDRADVLLSAPIDLAYATAERARLTHLNGHDAQARSLALNALEQLEQARGRASDEARVWAALAEVHTALGQDSLADAAFQTAISGAAKGLPSRARARTFERYAEYLEASDRPRDALEALKRAAGLLDLATNTPHAPREQNVPEYR